SPALRILTFPGGNRLLVVAVSRCSILTPSGPAQSPALRILTFPGGNRLLAIKIEFLEVSISRGRKFIRLICLELAKMREYDYIWNQFGKIRTQKSVDDAWIGSICLKLYQPSVQEIARCDSTNAKGQSF
ncbi:MAG: hypothetical protein M0P13_11200, partial [Fibrobacteraceae bacterium]|nr:hypothetical protein [Fibrobacteraceae bacterium]